MDRDPKLAVPQEVLTAHLDGEAVLLHMETKNYFRLNETAAYVWKALEQGKAVDAILDALCRDYQVDRDTARGEIERLLAELRERQLLGGAQAPSAETASDGERSPTAE